jgi:hypothetical protein
MISLKDTWIVSVDLLPDDKKHHEDMGDDSVMPTDWLECTGELHPEHDISFGKGTWKRFLVGELKIQYGQVCVGVASYFKNVHNEHSWMHIPKPNSTWNPFRLSMTNEIPLLTYESRN